MAEIIYTLVGWRKNDFDMNGNHFTGYRLYFTAPLSGSNGVGIMTSNVWYPDQKFTDLKPVEGMKCDIRYNRFGKVDRIVKL